MLPSGAPTLGGGSTPNKDRKLQLHFWEPKIDAELASPWRPWCALWRKVGARAEKF